jgi:hypothetical protein
MEEERRAILSEAKLANPVFDLGQKLKVWCIGNTRCVYHCDTVRGEC